MDDPSDVRLFGSTQAREIRDLISVGPLTMRFRNGALRRAEMAEVEIVRGLQFVVRDRYWRTIEPRLADYRKEATAGGVEAVWSLRFLGAQCDLAVDLRLAATSANFSLAARAVAMRETVTSRSGLVLLHPIATCRGRSVTVTSPDGRVTRGAFPSQFAAHAPFTEIARLEVEIDDALRVTARFEGEVFEMEDQRNWSDASFKTYSRPLRLPTPYRIEAGSAIEQKISIEIVRQGRAPRRRRRTLGPLRVRIRLGEQVGRMPSLGLGVDPDRAAPRGEAERCLLRDLGPAILSLSVRPATPDAALAAFAQLVQGSGAAAALEVEFADNDVEGEAGAFARRMAAAGVCPLAVGVHPTTPTALAVCRRAFPAARVGGGTLFFFAQLNRGKVPAKLDFVSWTVSPAVHDTADDAVMETLETLPEMLALARARWPATELRVGPNTLRPRFRPMTKGLALAPVDPPVPDDVDLRQTGLFGAAWTVGFIAQLAYAGVDTVLMFEPFGSRGVIGRPTDAAALPEGAVVFPVYHVLRRIMSGRGAPLFPLEVGPPGSIAGLAWGGAAPTALLANLTAEPQAVQIGGFDPARSWRLDEAGFPRATAEPALFDAGMPELASGPVMLPPYAVLCLQRAQVAR